MIQSKSLQQEMLRNYIQTIFNRYDNDKSGTLDVQEMTFFFNDLFRALNIPNTVTDAQSMEAIKSIDKDSDGFVNKEELFAVFKKMLNPTQQNQQAPNQGGNLNNSYNQGNYNNPNQSYGNQGYGGYNNGYNQGYNPQNYNGYGQQGSQAYGQGNQGYPNQSYNPPNQRPMMGTNMQMGSTGYSNNYNQGYPNNSNQGYPNNQNMHQSSPNYQVPPQYQGQPQYNPQNNQYR